MQQNVLHRYCLFCSTSKTFTLIISKLLVHERFLSDFCMTWVYLTKCWQVTYCTIHRMNQHDRMQKHNWTLWPNGVGGGGEDMDQEYNWPRTVKYNTFAIVHYWGAGERGLTKGSCPFCPFVRPLTHICFVLMLCTFACTWRYDNVLYSYSQSEC